MRLSIMTDKLMSGICLKQELEQLYEGWDGNQQFEGLERRWEAMRKEFFWSPNKINSEIDKCLSSVFKEPYSHMLVAENISVWTFCPHHILPCSFTVHIGYIPKGFVLGLSKFARVSVICGKRPIMQEQYTRELAVLLYEALKPEGLGVYVTGSHGCMKCRGVMQEGASVSTSILKGSFLTDEKVRAEFYSICRRNGGRS